MKIPIAYLNGEPIAVPACGANESIDICSGCLRTFIVGKHQALTDHCKEPVCPMAATSNNSAGT